MEKNDRFTIFLLFCVIFPLLVCTLSYLCDNWNLRMNYGNSNECISSIDLLPIVKWQCRREPVSLHLAVLLKE